MQNKAKSSKSNKAVSGLSLLAAGFMFVATPALAAILVQNFTQWDVVVDDPPITKVQGADADYDGDGDDATGILQVDLGATIGNDDDTLGTPGASETLLSHEEITFTCFAGDRTYYTDVIQLDNVDAAGGDWDVSLTVEADLAGTAAVADTFSAGDADIWLFTSEIDSTGGAVTEIPNPANYGSLTEWIDADAGDAGEEAIQLEVIAGTMSVVQASTDVTIPTTEQRQLGLVVDCGSNMVDTETGTFRLTVAATPN